MTPEAARFELLDSPIFDFLSEALRLIEDHGEKLSRHRQSPEERDLAVQALWAVSGAIEELKARVPHAASRMSSRLAAEAEDDQPEQREAA